MQKKFNFCGGGGGETFTVQYCTVKNCTKKQQIWSELFFPIMDKLGHKVRKEKMFVLFIVSQASSTGRHILYLVLLAWLTINKTHIFFLPYFIH